MLMWVQADCREAFLSALGNAGLRRTQQGSALVLTVYDVDQEIKVEDIGTMTLPDFLKLYTVNALKQG